ncbi:MAG: haloacid dehalogenase type II [SAR202 cluster bacterium]|nr:haloacid dehalogenase type II [SAR202 cluster bacterium]
MNNFSQFQVLTFDCYGTLIDWKSGLRSALIPILRRHGVAISLKRLLQLYGQFERELQSEQPFRDYRSILQSIVLRLGHTLDFHPTADDTASLPDSLGGWPPFPDTVPALKALKQRFKLAIISNTDRDLLALTLQKLEIDFDWLITSQDVGRYKPSHENFHYALKTIGLPKTQVLHVAQSMYHDIAPARQLGIATLWINRGDTTLTPDVDAEPDWLAPNLTQASRLLLSKAR